jgi:hypothetical protein
VAGEVRVWTVAEGYAPGWECAGRRIEGDCAGRSAMPRPRQAGVAHPVSNRSRGGHCSDEGGKSVRMCVRCCGRLCGFVHNLFLVVVVDDDRKKCTCSLPLSFLRSWLCRLLCSM